MSETRRAPSGVNYANLLPLGTRGTAKARKFMPNNGNTFTSQNNIVRIPLNSTGFLDTEHSYLAFNVTCSTAVPIAAGVGIKLDGGGNALIRRLRIEGSDGAELERVDNYNVIAVALSQLQQGEDHTCTVENAMDTNTYPGDASSANTYGTGAAPVNVKQGAYSTGAIATCGWAAGAQTSGAGAQKGISLKLMSGLLNNSKYLPVGFVAGGGVVLELTLDTDAIALCQITDAVAATPPIGAATAPDAVYTISDIYYVAQIVELNQTFNDDFRKVLNERGAIQWSGQTLRGHTYNFTSASNGTAVVPVAERSRSIKAMYHILRQASGDGSNQLVQDEFSLGRRTFNGTTSLQWKIGANVYPSQPLQGSQRNPSQYMAELIKSLASLGDIRQGSMINRQNFTGFQNAAIQGVTNCSGNPIGGSSDVAANRNGTPSLGFFGIDLETYSQSSDILESGIDTSSLSLPINVEFVFGADTRAAGTGGAAGAAGTQFGAGTFLGTILVNSYCLIDCIYSLDSQGLLTCAM